MGKRGRGLQNRCRRLERLSSGCQVVFGVDNMSRHLLLGFYGYWNTTTTSVGDGVDKKLGRLISVTAKIGSFDCQIVTC